MPITPLDYVYTGLLLTRKDGSLCRYVVKQMSLVVPKWSMHGLLKSIGET
jgi:hypothetical protein